MLGLGTAAVGLWTLFTGMATAFWQLLVLKVLTGCALSAVTPISQSIVSDIVPYHGIGRQFGIIGFWSSVGSMVGGGAATTVGYKKLGGLAGWRVIMFVAGALTILIGILAPLVATDPRADAPAPDGLCRPAKLSRLQVLQEQVRAARRKAGDYLLLSTYYFLLTTYYFRCARRDARRSTRSDCPPSSSSCCRASSARSRGMPCPSSRCGCNVSSPLATYLAGYLLLTYYLLAAM